MGEDRTDGPIGPLQDCSPLTHTHSPDTGVRTVEQEHQAKFCMGDAELLSMSRPQGVAFSNTHN